MAWKNVQYENGKYRTSEGGGGGSSTFADLDDVSFSNLQNGQVPKYNSTTQKWENANESGGGGTVTDVTVDGTSVVNQQGVAEIEMPTPPSVPDELSDLSDVQFSNLADHQPLRYNATSQKWVNGADNYPPLIYSDEEREIGVWRDGKPLYQKTLIVTSVVSGNNTINHGISNVDEIVNPIGTFFSNADNSSPIPNGNIQSAWSISMFDFGATNFKVSVGSSWIQYFDHIQVTLQYTKTTDTPGSGTWTTQGGYAHHYSTTEQVIGTWIDGKPLYEKTIYIASVTSGTSYQHNISNVKDISIYEIRAKRNTGWYSSGHIFQDGINNITESFSIIPSSTVLYAYLFGNTITDCYVTVQYTKTTD